MLQLCGIPFFRDGSENAKNVNIAAIYKKIRKNENFLLTSATASVILNKLEFGKISGKQKMAK